MDGPIADSPIDRSEDHGWPDRGLASTATLLLDRRLNRASGPRRTVGLRH
jgi:hypothetical protein